MSGVEVGDAEGHDMVPKESIVIESITRGGSEVGFARGFALFGADFDSTKFDARTS